MGKDFQTAATQKKEKDAPVPVQARGAAQIQDSGMYSPIELLDFQQTQQTQKEKQPAPHLATRKRNISSLQHGEKEDQSVDIQETEERKSFLSAEKMQTVTDNMEKQKTAMKSEVLDAENHLRRTYAEMVSHGFGSFSFFNIKRQLGRLLTLQTVWNQRISDPKTCELLQIETTDKRYQQMIQEVLAAVESYCAKHTRKGKSLRAQRRLDMVESLSVHLDTLRRMSGDFVTMKKEFDYAEKDAEGYLEAQTDDAVKLLSEKKKDAIKNYSMQDNFFEKNGKIFAKYQCINGLKRGRFSWDEFSPEQQEILKKSMKELDEILTESERKEDTLLYRGVNLGKVLGDRLTSPEKLVGKVITDAGFLSTSTQEKTAEDFIGRSAKFKFMSQMVKSQGQITPFSGSMFTGECKLKILSRKGSHGFDIAGESDYETEKEVMFASGTRMVIRKLETVENYDLTLTEDDIMQYNTLKGKMAVDFSRAGYSFTVQVPVFEVEIR